MSAQRKNLIISSLVVGIATIAAVVGAQELPEVPGDTGGGTDRCTGLKQPICQETEVCWGVGSSRQCTTDYYYFPGTN